MNLFLSFGVLVFCFVESVHCVNLQNLIFEFVCGELESLAEEDEKVKLIEAKKLFNDINENISQNLLEEEKFKKLMTNIILKLVKEKHNKILENFRNIAYGEKVIDEKFNRLNFVMDLNMKDDNIGVIKTAITFTIRNEYSKSAKIFAVFNEESLKQKEKINKEMEGILTALMIFKELFSIGFQEFLQEKTEKNKNVLNELNIRKPFNSKNELNELSKVKKNISQKYFLKELVKDLEEIISIHALQITPKTFHEIDFISIQKMRDEQIFEALKKFKNDKKNKKSEEKPLDDFDNLFEKENIPSPINEIMGKKDRNTKSAKSNEEQMQEDVNTDEDDEDKIFSMDFNKMGKYKEKQSPLKEDNLKINNEIRDISENDFLSPEKSTSPEIIGRKINKKRNNPLREPIRGSVITNNKMKSSDNQANSSPTPKRQKGHLNNKSTSDKAIKVADGKKKKTNKRVTFKFSPKLSKSP